MDPIPRMCAASLRRETSNVLKKTPATERSPSCRSRPLCNRVVCCPRGCPCVYVEEKRVWIAYLGYGLLDEICQVCARDPQGEVSVMMSEREQLGVALRPWRHRQT